MKQKKRLRILILLVLACLVLLATGTYAAYTNTAFVKRVVTTGIDTSAVPFSSNYLYADNGGNFVCHIITASASDTTINLTVCNYPKNDSTRFSNTNIQYTLTITVLNKDGQVVSSPPAFPVISPGNYTDVELTGNQISYHSYALTFSPETVTALADYTLRITATPTRGLTTPQTLAAEFRVVPDSGQNQDWDGHVVETDSAESLDGFNYEISGTAKGEVVIDWSQSADYVTLSKWFWLDLGQTPNPNATQITFSVGGENQPTSYLLQFYRLKGCTKGDTIPIITSSFSPTDNSSPANPSNP